MWSFAITIWRSNWRSEVVELTDWKNAKFRHTLAMAHANYATDLLNQGKLDAAIEHLRQAIEADPDFEAPLFNLASCSPPAAMNACSVPTKRLPWPNEPASWLANRILKD